MAIRHARQLHLVVPSVIAEVVEVLGIDVLLVVIAVSLLLGVDASLHLGIAGSKPLLKLLGVVEAASLADEVDVKLRLLLVGCEVMGAVP